MMIGRTGIVLSVAFLCGAVLGQSLPPKSRPVSFDELHQQAVAKNPADATLVITLDAGRTQFHMGETISLTMRFSSTAPGKYRIWRLVGRLRAANERVHVDPGDGTADPFLDYRFGPFAGLGSGNFQSLTTVTFPLELNDWVRFDKPGKYRLFVEAPRLKLFDGVQLNPATDLDPFIAVASNVLELEILPPDAAWIEAQLASAARVLADKQLPEARRIEATNILKNLQTEDAARELLRNFSGAPANSLVTQWTVPALYASRYRALVREGVQKLLADPKTAPAVTPRFLWWVNTPPAAPVN
jgi:hypothetical protein